MSEIAVRVEGLGKRYLIGGKQEAYRTIRDSLADAVISPVRRISNVIRGRSDSASGMTEAMWALEDVSFDVKRGEVVGIIGRNGAGKSTLLKILSRITEPTEGRVLINGRVGALLEVGTGFHPELTGRENIYLNAAILGMKRHEIERKFDEIVDFAEIEKFIDTPVKHYSSGMGLRLGFAVAAHMDPEILIVDEVLAVGDAAFQQKCIGKMNNVASEGRTVLFVSHNMSAIIELCSRAVYLRSGKIESDGEVLSTLSQYVHSTELISEEISAPTTISAPVEIARIIVAKRVQQGKEFSIGAMLRVRRPITYARMNIVLFDSLGKKVIHLQNDKVGLENCKLGVVHFRGEFPSLWLASAIYTVKISMRIRDTSGVEYRTESPYAPLEVIGDTNKFATVLHPKVEWKLDLFEEVEQ